MVFIGGMIVLQRCTNLKERKIWNADLLEDLGEHQQFGAHLSLWTVALCSWLAEKASWASHLTSSRPAAAPATAAPAVASAEEKIVHSEKGVGASDFKSDDERQTRCLRCRVSVHLGCVHWQPRPLEAWNHLIALERHLLQQCAGTAVIGIFDEDKHLQCQARQARSSAKLHCGKHNQRMHADPSSAIWKVKEQFEKLIQQAAKYTLC